MRVEGRLAAEASLSAGIVSHAAAEAMSSWCFAARAFAAERTGYDACALGATTDPGPAAARSIAATPGRGLGETAFPAGAEPDPASGVVRAAAELEDRLRAGIDGDGITRRGTVAGTA